MNFDDTIAAIATAPGEAGISIVRVSGPDSFRIADLIFRCSAPRPSERAPSTFVHGLVINVDTVVDEALLLLMRAPHSYTGEDAVEIQGHGGTVSAKRVLRCVLDAGARLADPGEFTKRAFLNGRIDLLQAESVLDLIKARTDRSAAMAVEQLEGTLSNSFTDIYDKVMRVAADLEATLDFPEDELPKSVMTDIADRLGRVNAEMQMMLDSRDEGRLLRDGVLVVISGKPNVGKSTIMNCLLGSDRAIVSHIPGTTRDTIEEGLVIDGLYVRLVDTAGLRPADDIVEHEGIRRAKDQMSKADFHVYVVDGSQPLDDDDRNHASALDVSRSILVLNKSDLGLRGQSPKTDLMTIYTCGASGQGVTGLKSALSEKINACHKRAADHHVAISERHFRLLRAAKTEVASAAELVGEDLDECVPLAADRLRGALEQLGLITGRVYHNELLDSIFSRFCIGK